MLFSRLCTETRVAIFVFGLALEKDISTSISFKVKSTSFCFFAKRRSSISVFFVAKHPGTMNDVENFWKEFSKFSFHKQCNLGCLLFTSALGQSGVILIATSFW